MAEETVAHVNRVKSVQRRSDQSTENNMGHPLGCASILECKVRQ